METPSPPDSPQTGSDNASVTTQDGVPVRRVGADPATLAIMLAAMQAAEEAVGAAVQRMNDAPGPGSDPTDP
ncbi:MAG: hypothetical protein KF740_03090 [Ramlibacter sp.]|nr:hypothetical protein [Ramlibacter sp.]